MNKVRAGLAVGINEIHPLLIVPSQPKGLAEGKGQTAWGETKKLSTMNLQRMLFLFYRVNLCPASGHFPLCLCSPL